MAMGTQTELSQLNIKQATTDDVVRQMEEQGKLGANEIILTPKGTAVPMMPVGSIFMSAIPQTDARVHLLDGSTISQTGMYETFANKIKGLSNMWIPIACTQEEFDADVQATGNCGKFVIDNDAGTIRLPKITTFIQGLTDISNIGSSLSAGLPNITGYFAGSAWINQGGSSGAFYVPGRKEDSSMARNSSSGNNAGMAIDASRSSVVYGKSDTVQPNATQYPYYIVLASGYKSNEVVDINNVVSDINKKANADFSNVNYPQNTAGSTTFGVADRVIETYISSDGSTWYRKWVSGRMECGGVIISTADGGETKNITFPVTFTSTPTVIFALRDANGNNTGTASYRTMGYKNLTTTGFSKFIGTAGSYSRYYVFGW